MTDNGSTNDPAGTTPPDDNLKSQTSRISLDSARSPKSPLEAKKGTGLVPGIPTHAGPIPQTIRLKRPPTSPITVQPADLPSPAKKPGDTALVLAPTAVRPMTAETVKRQTSRIELDQTAAPVKLPNPPLKLLIHSESSIANRELKNKALAFHLRSRYT